jgi:hypothetical protein
MIGTATQQTDIPYPSSNAPVRRSSRSVVKDRIASALCLLPALYCAGVVLFALASPQDYASALPQIVRYIIVPGSIALALLLVALRSSRLTRVNVGGTACALLLALFLTEAHLEYRYGKAIAAMLRSSAAGPGPDVAGPRGLPPGHTVKKLNRMIGITELDRALLGGIPHSNVALCTRAGQPVGYRADRYGFRNPDHVHDGPSDLLLIGDSFIEGICLPDGQDLAGQVRQRSGSMVSLGMRGAGPLTELAMLGRFGPLVRPRWTVIAFYEGNDWENLAKELATPWLAQALNGNADFGRASPAQPAIDRAGKQIEQWVREESPGLSNVLARSHLTRNFLALHQTWSQLGLGYPKAASPIPEYERILARAREISAGWGGRVAILYIPQSGRFIGALPNQFVYDQLRDKVRAAAAKNGIPVIDLSRSFSGQGNPLELFGENHLSPEGAAHSADYLTRHLKALEKRPG